MSPTGSAGKPSGRPITCSSTAVSERPSIGSTTTRSRPSPGSARAIPSLRLGTSIIVVPQRNAVVLAKELATLDSLTGGRVLAGVGVGWNLKEFGNLGAADRFHVRGAYLNETIELWRHLWSGSTEPFAGRFHSSTTSCSIRCRPRARRCRSSSAAAPSAALQRAGRLGDGYHSSAIGPDGYATRIPVIRAAAEAAGRPMPTLSARARVALRPTDDRSFVLRARFAGGNRRGDPRVRRSSASSTSRWLSPAPRSTRWSLAAERFAEEAALLVD